MINVMMMILFVMFTQVKISALLISFCAESSVKTMLYDQNDLCGLICAQDVDSIAMMLFKEFVANRHSGFTDANS